jgi:hypothetical protein
MVHYDPAILQKYANMLYTRAYLLIGFYALVGGGIGWAATYAYQESHHLPSSDLPFLGVAIGAVLGGLLGNWRAFMLKLYAQLVLCEMKIEQHTNHLEGVADRVASAQAPNSDTHSCPYCGSRSTVQVPNEIGVDVRQCTACSRKWRPKVGN